MSYDLLQFICIATSTLNTVNKYNMKFYNLFENNY